MQHNSPCECTWHPSRSCTNSPVSVKAETSLPHSEASTDCSYSDSDDSWPHPPIHVPTTHFNIIVQNTCILCKLLLPFTFLVHNRDSAVGLVSKVSIRLSWIRFPAGEMIFLTAKSSRPTLPTFQWVRGIISLEVKQPEREADYWIPSSAWRAQGYC